MSRIAPTVWLVEAIALSRADLSTGSAKVRNVPGDDDRPVGYPRGLDGDRIHPTAMALGSVDHETVVPLGH